MSSQPETTRKAIDRVRRLIGQTMFNRAKYAKLLDEIGTLEKKLG